MTNILPVYLKIKTFGNASREETHSQFIFRKQIVLLSRHLKISWWSFNSKWNNLHQINAMENNTQQFHINENWFSAMYIPYVYNYIVWMTLYRCKIGCMSGYACMYGLCVYMYGCIYVNITFIDNISDKFWILSSCLYIHLYTFGENECETLVIST